MDAISISAASGMKARMESLELLANNLANVETGGFKGDREFYSLYTSLDASTDPQTGDLTTLPVIEKHWTDLAQGDLHTTGNPLDFAIDGDGLFVIQTPRGIRYTRNGSFRLSATGVLTTIDGSSVRAKGGGQIQLQPGLPVQVQTDGSVSQGAQVAGQMELVTFSAGTVNKDLTIGCPSLASRHNLAKGVCCRAGSKEATWEGRNRQFAWSLSCGSLKCCRRR
jgi:flagellar basal body rod protein FlgG